MRKALQSNYDIIYFSLTPLFTKRYLRREDVSNMLWAGRYRRHSVHTPVQRSVSRLPSPISPQTTGLSFGAFFYFFSTVLPTYLKMKTAKVALNTSFNSGPINSRY